MHTFWEIDRIPHEHVLVLCGVAVQLLRKRQSISVAVLLNVLDDCIAMLIFLIVNQHKLNLLDWIMQPQIVRDIVK